MRRYGSKHATKLSPFIRTPVIIYQRFRVYGCNQLVGTLEIASTLREDLLGRGLARLSGRSSAESQEGSRVNSQVVS